MCSETRLHRHHPGEENLGPVTIERCGLQPEEVTGFDEISLSPSKRASQRAVEIETSLERQN